MNQEALNIAVKAVQIYAATHPGIASAPGRLKSADAERLYYPPILIFSIVRNPARPSIPITNSMRLSESNGGGVNPGM